MGCNALVETRILYLSVPSLNGKKQKKYHVIMLCLLMIQYGYDMS